MKKWILGVLLTVVLVSLGTVSVLAGGHGRGGGHHSGQRGGQTSAGQCGYSGQACQGGQSWCDSNHSCQECGANFENGRSPNDGTTCDYSENCQNQGRRPQNAIGRQGRMARH